MNLLKTSTKLTTLLSWPKPDENRVVSLHEICRQYPQHPSTFRREVARGAMPLPIELSPGRIGWYSQEIDQAYARRRRPLGKLGRPRKDDPPANSEVDDTPPTTA
jgi:predicted DNA-binding transcriptional regulator AlpA